MRAWGNRGLTTQGLLGFAAVIVTIELVLAASQTAPLARIGWANYKAPPRLVRDADLDPFSTFGPTQVVAAARQTIPRDATYAIVVGHTPIGASPELVADVLRFWLLPRKYTTKLSDAQWVIAYHQPSERLGVRYTQELGLGPDANVVKVKR